MTRRQPDTLPIFLTCALCILLGSACEKTRKPVADTGPVEAGFQPDAGPVDSAGIMAMDSPACPESCDDKNPCTVDTCNLASFQCDHTPLPDETPCQGRACFTGGRCNGGLCFDGPFKTCLPVDTCHQAGVCNVATGECTAGEPLSRGLCDDSDPCTYADQCQAGVCAGTPMCPAPLVCDADAGRCTDPGGKPVFPSALTGRTYINLTGAPSPNGLLTDPAGKLYFATNITGPSDLGGGPVQTSTNLPPLGKDGNTKDVLLAQLDPATGTAVWAKPFFGQKDQVLKSFAVNGTGQIGALGSFQGDFQDDQGSSLLLALTPTDQFVFGANASDGKWLWGRRMNLHLDKALNLGLSFLSGDPSGNALVACGATNKAATDIAKSMVWWGGTDAVVARFDGTTGETIWGLQIGGVADENCSATAMDGDSNVFMAGTYAWGSTLAFKGVGEKTVRLDSVNAIKGKWSFLAKLDVSGAAVWAKSLGSGNQIVSINRILPVGGDVVISGLAQNESENQQLAGFALVGKETPFFARVVGSTGEVKWLKSIGTEPKMVVAGMAPASNGQVLLAGTYSFGGKLGAFPLPEPASSTRLGAFIAKIDDSSGTVLIAKGFGDPTLPSSGLGIVNRPNALGDEKNSSLLLTSFLGKVDFGPPLGILDTGTGSFGNAMALVKFAP